MNKKFVAVLVLLLAVSTVSVFALGIGAQAGVVAGAGSADGALTIKPDGSDVILAINGNIGSDWGYVGISGDKWAANKVLAKPINYFYGLGAAGGVNLGGNTLSIGVYGRAVIGLNCFLLDDFLEIYLQGAWQPGVVVAVGGEAGVTPVLYHFPVNLGVRFWL